MEQESRRGLVPGEESKIESNIYGVSEMEMIQRTIQQSNTISSAGRLP